MNELQQVLLVFAVVVIAGLYFLSRSRQNTMKKNSEDSAKPEATANHTPKATQPVNESKSESPSEALNNLGSPHIPLSESTERRITQGQGFSNPEMTPVDNQSAQVHHEEVNHNQGVLSFGEEFDLPQQTQAVKAVEIQTSAPDNVEQTPVAEIEVEKAPKHHVLIVDDPGMTGEIDENTVSADFVKPSFGIPEEELTSKKHKASTNKEPEVYVLLVMSSAQEFKMTDVNQALLGVGLSYSEQGIFVKKDNMGNVFIKVANMLEPGTFPQENLQNYMTPGVAMILELPTTVRAPAAMHDLIMMARKISQRLHGRLYNMERHLIKESDLQSMRDAALDYESEPIA
ncbi:MAG: cell division protein ZipA C-terminal FtsZ-binding domain-containing protein [Thiomicrorhabdus sp.]|nr:cell division protein ZipA C-terminal FtsZ-binding domain-containing protein [Thiomicrorhabdus sp.]